MRLRVTNSKSKGKFTAIVEHDGKVEVLGKGYATVADAHSALRMWLYNHRK